MSDHSDLPPFERVVVWSLGLALVISASLLLSSCASYNQSKVVNGCEITALNYQAVLDAKNTLNPTFHSRILIVGYTLENGEMKVYHAYCVWRSKEMYFAYDYTGTAHVATNLQNIPDPLFFARQLQRTAFEGYYEGEKYHDSDFEN